MGTMQILLGNAGMAIVEWLTKNAGLFAAIFGAYVIMYLAASYQMSKIRRKTEELVSNKAIKLLKDGRKLEPKYVYEQIFPEWVISLKKWALFVPGYRELWFVPANSKNVLKRFDFSVKWVAKQLEKKGFIENKTKSSKK